MRTVLSCVAGAIAALATPVSGSNDTPPALVALVLDSSGSVGAADLAWARDLALLEHPGPPCRHRLSIAEANANTAAGKKN